LEIYQQLNNKFSENLKSSISTLKNELAEAESKAKILYEFGLIMNIGNVDETNRQINEIYSEIFSDLTVSIYLALCSLDNASRVLIRRVLELGIATFYFRDMPHKFWHWRLHNNHESDLNFKENIEFLSSDSYKLFLLNGHQIKWDISKERINKLYRDLSNIIHGKYDTFETKSITSFSYNEIDLKENISKIILCEDILIYCISQRHPSVFKQLEEKFPSLERYNNVQ
jgi:hypothetical protein